jgi:hypothetical protein
MVSSALIIRCVFRQDSPFPEIADQVKRCPEGYDILEKEQPQEAHIPHPVKSSADEVATDVRQ